LTGPLRPLLLLALVLPGGMTPAAESLGAPDRPSLGVAPALDGGADGVADAESDGATAATGLMSTRHPVRFWPGVKVFGVPV
jgi:hypothetical protein